MQHRLTRTFRSVLTATAIAALTTGGLALSTGTAAATTLQANSCTAGVTGVTGDAVAISGASVKDLVKAGAQEAGTLAVGDWAGNDIAKVSSIKVGQVGQGASTQVSGSVIGTAVAKALEETGSWGLGIDRKKTLASVEKKVAGNCGLTAYASDYREPTSEQQPAPQPGGSTGSQPGGTNQGQAPGKLPLGTGGAMAPPPDYSNIPAATPGVALPPGARYGSAAPGPTSPEFGILGADPGTTQAPQVQNAGNADSLAAGQPENGVQLPMLLAVVALAGVTAALVRTWVLRKAS
ncbi:hypothetical protein [Amycolatopsis magusensis]|uniref:hypothetical protein n=1 Tax=Amycolatopsis magusensis TaxID=882444 RepID=UPI0024A7E236|nr:hypothetical protein [Amycolatopsis magusensis]MDI5981975.1 hypothetical protein [Amycolatopsis magusensis]